MANIALQEDLHRVIRKAGRGSSRLPAAKHSRPRRRKSLAPVIVRIR
jgi:hypothetical protein